MKSWLAVAGSLAFASAAGAAPVVVGHGACPTYAVDIEAFATCDHDRVAMPEEVRLAGDVLIAEEVVPQGRRTRAALCTDARSAYALKGSHPADVGPDGKRSLNGWKNAGLLWSARVDTALISAER